MSSTQRDIDNDTLEESDTLPIPSGTRVKLRGKLVAATLRSPYGRVIGPDIWDGFCIVELDEPALFRRADGGTDALMEIRESYDNLIVISE